MDRSLLDKLAIAPTEPVNIRDCWTPEEIEQVAVAIANFGINLRERSLWIRAQRKLRNVENVRCGIAFVLFAGGSQ
jgi:hypothetical protein